MHTGYNVKSHWVNLPATGRPGVLPSVTSTETEVAVLFADVVGSTRLYELLGDQHARELIQLCVEIMRDATERNRGTVIKTIGDEILAIFPTVDDAVNAGGEMQQDIGARPELLVQGQHVAIRIGCHFGPVVLENKDIFGASVHTANRMTSQAKAGQIILVGGYAAPLLAGVARRFAPRGHHVAARPQRRDGALRGAVAAGRRDQHAAVDRDGRHARPRGACACGISAARSCSTTPARKSRWAGPRRTTSSCRRAR